MNSGSSTGTPSTVESLGFSPAHLENNFGTDTPDMMDFEVSGLGGVQPEDNFSIRVQRSQIPTGLTGTHIRRPGLYSSKIRAIFGDKASQNARRRSASPKMGIQEHVISAVHRDMPSSALPPASFFPLDSASSGEVSDDEQSSDDESETGGPSTALQLLNVAPPATGIASDRSVGDSSEASEYSEDSDDGSIDLLATARQQDPDTVRAFEREYDAAVADRFAEEIVAGSSAATAGGGSGFNSPASLAGGRSKQGSRKSTRNARSTNSEASLSPRSRNLKRARTGESIATVMNNGTKALKSQRTE